MQNISPLEFDDVRTSSWYTFSIFLAVSACVLLLALLSKLTYDVMLKIDSASSNAGLAIGALLCGLIVIFSAISAIFLRPNSDELENAEVDSMIESMDISINSKV